MSATEKPDRLRTLLETGIAISSELSLDAVLQRIVEAAARGTDARYAALGVIDATGTGLERFVTTGVDDETHQAIGHLPRGRGILGVLIHDAQSLRLHELGDDPRSVGFPPGHPPMHTFLGTPIRLHGVAYGNLYLTEKAGGADFDEDDEELAALLAEQAGLHAAHRLLPVHGLHRPPAPPARLGRDDPPRARAARGGATARSQGRRITWRR